MSPQEIVHLRLIQVHRVHHVPELRGVVVDHLHHLVVDGLVLERIARDVRAVVSVMRAVVGIVRAVVGVMRAVVVMVHTVICIEDVRHVLVQQAGGLHRGDEPISGDRFPIDVHALS